MGVEHAHNCHTVRPSSLCTDGERRPKITISTVPLFALSATQAGTPQRLLCSLEEFLEDVLGGILEDREIGL